MAWSFLHDLTRLDNQNGPCLEAEKFAEVVEAALQSYKICSTALLKELLKQFAIQRNRRKTSIKNDENKLFDKQAKKFLKGHQMN